VFLSDWQLDNFGVIFATLYKKEDFMNTIRTLMLKHPLISILLILPFTLVITIAIFSFILKVLLPGMLALWMAGWVYSAIVGHHWRKNINEPFWFVRTRTYSV